jgi:predicted transposase/invertase (TIGR01784 family)
VIILKESLLPLAKAHSTFRILEVETHRELTNDLEMHFIELSKVDLARGNDALAGWMLFLLARNDEELEEVAMTDPDIRRATEALRALSQDPEAQELARQREMAQINLKIMHQFAVAEGRAEGRAEGEAKGRAKGRTESLRLAIETAADLLAIEITKKRRDEMNGLDVDGLTAMLGTLRAERRWPGET